MKIPADLVEEIGRIYGYDRLTPTLLDDSLPPQRRNVMLEGQEKMRDVMVGCGLDEVITYSIVDLTHEARLDARSLRPLDLAYPHMTMLNPLSAERAHLRGTLMPELLNTVRATTSASPIGSRSSSWGGSFSHARMRRCPPNRVKLSAAMIGPREPRHWQGSDATPLGFFDLKGVVEELLERLGIADVEWERGEHPALHPGRTARLMIRGEDAGSSGNCIRSVRAAFDLPEQPVAVMELDAGRADRGVGRCATDDQPFDATGDLRGPGADGG